MKKLVLACLSFLLILSACSNDKPIVLDPDKETTNVVTGAKGNYSILTPFVNSLLRQEYAPYFREVDMVEIGRQLISMSKDHFAPDNYYIGEGSLIDVERYYQLMAHESETRPYGLNPKRGESITLSNGTVLENPQFVSDIVELNFHRTTNQSQIDGIAIALVLKRVQVLDASIGSTVSMSDEDLLRIGGIIGIRLQTYLRSIDGMVDVPLFMGLYVQESDIDPLPGRYLPGYYIGRSFSQSAPTQFEAVNARWYFLNSKASAALVPQYDTNFTLFKNSILNFMGDESVSVIAKVFASGSDVSELAIQVTTGAKTYMELYALTQFISQNAHFLKFDTSVTVTVRISETTRFVISKEPGQAVVIKTII